MEPTPGKENRAKLATTPEQIQQLFSLPADCGTVKVPRLAMAFRGVHPRDRRTFQASYLPMIMAGAIPAEGQHPGSVKGWRQGVTQAEMSAAAGIHRTTFTRRMSKLSDPAAGYADASQRRAKALARRRSAMARLLLHQAGMAPHSRHLQANYPPVEIHCAACQAGRPCATVAKLEKLIALPVGDLEHYQRPLPTPILYRSRRFGMASRYAVRLGQRQTMLAIVEVTTGSEVERFLKADKAAESCARLNAEAEWKGSSSHYQVETVKLDGILHSRAPSVAELRQDPESAAWWQPEPDAEGHEPVADEGYKARSRWVWDSRILDPDTMDTLRPRPLGNLARELMSYYESKGLLEEWRGAPEPGGDPHGPIVKHSGLLQIHQAKVARELGCDPSSVYRANCKWEKLGVLRIAAGNPRKTERGYRRGAQIVIYLPFRTLSDAEADAEAERMSQRIRQLAASQYAARLWGAHGTNLQAAKALELHRALLDAWRGKEHSQVAFWREASRRLDAAGVSSEFYRYCIPPTRRERPPG